ncbi:ArsR/SmtB family transcription factor [Actinomyces haliotis]|uniref:ArsR/SmtB family transcription factor n=1 Tax=Actinomyces haliotis TaxID=1280843 RepID=UPI00188F8000|nr:metalloregulator ArsR/SmtB family transcription factor [Actinomyces haliotis]
MPIIHGLLPTDATDDRQAVQTSADVAAVLAALGDPTRLAIVSHLRGGEHRVGELAAHLGLAQSTVSQHLAVLRGAGLISTHTHGRSRVSRLEHEDRLIALLTLAADLTGAPPAPDEATSDEEAAS